LAKATHEHHGGLAPRRPGAPASRSTSDRGAERTCCTPASAPREIEISRADADGDARRVHTGVHDRTTHERALLTAVFGSLPAGDYVVWKDATTRRPVVTVPAGAVAESRIN
jgi:hypothetical protein